MSDIAERSSLVKHGVRLSSDIANASEQIPVFFFTPIHLGGFGFNPLQISLFMGLGGLAQSLWLLVAFPWFQGRYGTKWVTMACGTAYPFFYAFYPLFNVILRYDMTILFWVAAPIFTALGSGVAMSFTSVQLTLNDVSPGPEVLGTLNALALTLVSGLRGVSPAGFASLFALSVRSRIFGGHLIWILMIALAASFTVVSRWTPDPQTEESNKSNGQGDQNGVNGRDDQ